MSCNKYTKIHEPLLGDNRDFTDYRSNQFADYSLKLSLNCNSKDYKQRLIEKSELLKNNENNVFFKKNGIYKCN